MKSKKVLLKDFEVTIKFKLAALWTAATFCYLYGDYFELYTPDKVKDSLSGEDGLQSPLILFTASAVMVILPLMIILSLVLITVINKWL